MPFRTCILLAVAVFVSCVPVTSGEPKSQSTMSGGSNYRVDTSSSSENGKHIQRVTIAGNGISDHLEFQSPTATSLSVYNTNSKLIVADPNNMDLLVYSDKPRTLVIMKDGVCTEKSYQSSSTGTSSTTRQMSDSECQAIRRKASEEMEKNRAYWDKWGKDFDKNMQNTFPPGFPFQNQQHNPGSSMFSGNVFQGLADMGSNMQKTFFPGFPFKKDK